MTPSLTLADPTVKAILADVRGGMRIRAATAKHGYNPGSSSHWHKRIPGWTDALAAATRMGGRTGLAKREFIELVAGGMPVGEAARRVGKSPSGPWQWAKHDPDFRAAYAALAGGGRDTHPDRARRFRRLLGRLYAGAGLIDAALAEGYCLTTVRRWRRAGNGRWSAVSRALAMGGGDGLPGQARREERAA